jgi:hypothetical protein
VKDEIIATSDESVVSARLVSQQELWNNIYGSIKLPLISSATVKYRTSDLRTPEQRKLGPGNVQKIEERAGTLLVNLVGCRNKIPFPRWGKTLNAASSLKSILEEYWISK